MHLNIVYEFLNKSFGTTEKQYDINELIPFNNQL